MNRSLMLNASRFSIAISIVILITAASAAQELNRPPENFQALFNGKDTLGWYGWATKNPEKLWAMSAEEQAHLKKESRKDIEQHWSVKDGVLVNDGHGLYLTSEQEFGDFELHLEYKTCLLYTSPSPRDRG